MASFERFTGKTIAKFPDGDGAYGFSTEPFDDGQTSLTMLFDAPLTVSNFATWIQPAGGTAIAYQANLPSGAYIAWGDWTGSDLAVTGGALDPDATNWTVSIDAVSNDPGYTGGSLWGMYGDRTSPANPYGSQAGEAWQAGYVGTMSTVVGIIDTGIDYTHPDLYLNVWLNQREIPTAFKSKLIDADKDGLITFRDLNNTANAAYVADKNGNGRIDAGDLLKDTSWANGIDEDADGYRDALIGWDFVNNDNDPYDDNRHGTHVAGTIGGIGGNGIGVAGVNWNVEMVAMKFLNAAGSGSLAAATSAVNFFTAAASRAVGPENFVATNNSWGGGGYYQPLADAIGNAAKRDIVFVGAAGNSNSNNDIYANYPSNYSTKAVAGYDAVVAVASIDSNGGRSSFSSYGRQTVDLGAPGGSVYSTLPGGGYGTLSGTSMATPHVTGAIALYASAHPNATAAQIEAALYGSVVATPSLSGITATGGRLDVGNLLGSNPAILSIAAASAVKAEGGAGAIVSFTFTATRTGNTGIATSATWTVAGTGANPASGADFQGGILPSGTVSFGAGETSKTIAVNVLGDAVFEADEGFTVVLGAPSANTTIGTASAAGTILNDDIGPAILSIAAASAVKAEGGAGAIVPFTFTATRTGNIGIAASAKWTVAGTGANPAAAADFQGAVLPSGTVSFAAGETSKTVTVNVSGDAAIEADEGFTVVLGTPSANSTIGTASAAGTILNDDTAPTILSIAAASAAKAEGGAGAIVPFTFTATRTGNTGIAASAKWTVAGTGATPASGADFQGGVLPSGTVSFAAGETSKTIVVNVLGDTAIEADEGFSVVLSAPSANTTIGAASAAGTILNDDMGTTFGLGLAATGLTRLEGTGGATLFNFTVTRPSGSGWNLVPWAVSGTGVKPASASDFVGNIVPSGTISWALGQTSKDISFLVNSDTVQEGDETFEVTIGPFAYLTLRLTVGVGGTILNDDGTTLRSLSIQDFNVPSPMSVHVDSPDALGLAAGLPNGFSAAPWLLHPLG